MRRIVFALVLTGVAVPAAAQPTPWSPERFTAGWVVTPSVAFGGLWDSNPMTVNEGNPRDPDTLGLVNPRTEVDFNGKRAKFTAGYSGTFERYQNLSELTRYNQRGRLEALYEMTPRLSFETRHQVSMTPTTDFLDVEGVHFTRVGAKNVTSWGGFSYALSPRTKLKTNYSFQWIDFNREAEQQNFRFLQGGHAHTPAAELTYALHRRITVGALYNFRRTVIDAGKEVSNGHRAQATLAVVATPTTTVHARAGIDYLALVGETQAESGPSYGGGISQKIHRAAAIEASYDRALIPSFGFGGLSASDTLRVGGSVPFGRFSLAGGFIYRRTEPVILTELLVDLDTYWTYATAGYAVTRWLRMEGVLTVNRQFSSAQGDVERTRVGIQFVTSKPVRIQ